MKKNAFLIGGYQTTQALIESFKKKSYRITIVNANYDICREMAEISGTTVVHGDGSKPYVLFDTNIYGADIVIALTDSDDDNLVICQLAKKKFGVKRALAIVNDPRKLDFFRKMGIDSVVCPVTTLSHIIEQQALMEDISQLVSIGEGRVNISQILVMDGAPSIGKKLRELGLPNDVIISCILRKNQNIIPYGETEIAEGDSLILVSVDNSQAQAIRQLTGR
jgi:trk system potassium uptake protein TrkA